MPDDEEEQGESMENEVEKSEQSSSKLSPSNYAPVIHTSTNLYQLADIATMAPDIAALTVRDDEEVAESDRMAEERWSRICESLS
ncbi:unnamed protein product, partial [Anisakis simplex]|uniref:Uncharacterized protein n=1 Tax=Anisakis simplex TaxID=6269 RepID=A0A0M3JL85_ANISI